MWPSEAMNAQIALGIYLKHLNEAKTSQELVEIMDSNMILTSSCRNKHYRTKIISQWQDN
jgi:hypothetical protein